MRLKLWIVVEKPLVQTLGTVAKSEAPDASIAEKHYKYRPSFLMP